MGLKTRAGQVRATRTTPHTRPPAPGAVRLSVVIPAYREVEHIAGAIERVRSELGSKLKPGDLEVVVVDDGSGDGTAEAARAADLVIPVAINQGKGAAVRAGMLAASGRTRAFTDADLSYAPAQIMGLLVAVESGWDVVVGSRFHAETTTVVEASVLREVGGRVINAATRLVLSGRHADTQCGLKAFRSDVAETMFGHSRVNGFAFDVELFMIAEQCGLSLTEVPVEVENSERSTVHVARDASRLLVDLARMRVDLARGRYSIEPAELERLLR